MTDEVEKLKALNKQLEQSLKYATDPNSGLYDEVVESNKYLEYRIKTLEESVRRKKDKIEAFTDKVKELEDELAKERFSYTCLKRRTDRAEGKLNIIKLTLNNEEKQ